MASDFMRRERKGSDFGFALSCTSGHRKNDDLGVWRLDMVKEKEHESFEYRMRATLSATNV